MDVVPEQMGCAGILAALIAFFAAAFPMVAPDATPAMQADEPYTTEIVIGVADGVEYDEESLQISMDIIEARLNGADVTSAEVFLADEMIHVLLGDADLETIVPLLTEQGLLEFVDFSGIEADDLPVEGDCIFTDYQVENQLRTDCSEETRPIQHPDGEPFVTIMTNEVIDGAVANESENTYGSWLVAVEITDEGTSVFGEFTSTHIGQPLAIVVNGEVLIAPTIQARIEDSAFITGNFTQPEAEQLAIVIREQALSIPLEVIEVNLLED